MSKTPRQEPKKQTGKPRAPVGRPRADGRPHLTRERVFKVCAGLIAEQGYSGTGIRAMASALEASPASLFNLFGSKDGLLSELIAYAAQPSLDFYAALDEADASASVKLYKSIFEEVIAVASADQDHAALFYLPELRKPELKSAQKIRAAMVAHYHRLIVSGIDQGDLVTSNAQLTAEQVFQMTETTIVASPAIRKLKPIDIATHTADFCLRGLLLSSKKSATLASRAAQIPLRIEMPQL